VHAPLVDRTASGHEGLGGYLTAEDTLAFFVGLGSTKDVDLNVFEVEKVDEKIERFRHAYIVGETAFG
jgi:hypothetical protein